MRDGRRKNEHGGNWTAAEDETLKKLWFEGYSASQIATQMGNFRTRNSIVGRVHRLKLTGKRKTRTRTYKKTSPAAVSRPVRPASKPRPKATAKAEKAAQRAPEPPVELNPVFPSEGSPDSSAWEALPGSNPVLVEDHVDGCRWPIGDPLTEGPYFCNQKVEGDKVYCPTHDSLSRKRKPDREEEEASRAKAA